MAIACWSLILVVGIQPLAAALGAAAPQGQADAQAREAAGQFVRSLKAEDARAVVKASDLPFFWDGQSVVTGRDELEAALARVFEEKDFTGLDFEVKEVYPAARLPDLVPKGQRGVAEKAAAAADRVVVVAVREERLVVLVRVRDGKSKVAGFFD